MEREPKNHNSKEGSLEELYGAIDEKIEALTEGGEGDNYITADELIDSFPELDGEKTEIILEIMDKRGIHFEDHEEDALSEGENGIPLTELNPHDTQGIYMKEGANHEILTREEEITLAKKIEASRKASELITKTKDKDEIKRLSVLIEEGVAAGEKMIRSNQRLVISVAKKYQNKGLPFLDLVQAGNLGMLRALKKFEWQRGYKFSTYAVWWIRQGITRALYDGGRTIRVPVHTHEEGLRLLRRITQLEQKLGETPTDEEIAEETGMSVKKIRNLKKWLLRPMSLEQPVGTDEEAELGDFIEDSDSPPLHEIVESKLLAPHIRKLLSELTPREATVISLRFGLKNGQTHTLEEVGQKYGITRERARQIEREALRKLKKSKEAKELIPFIKND